MMRDKNRRQAMRTATPENWAIRSAEAPDIDAEFKSSSDIRLVDRSSDGIGIRTHEPLGKDKVISFDLCFSNEYYRITAKVLWTSNDASGSRSGLQILKMPEDLMEEIEDYLSGIEKRKTLN